MTDLFDVAGKVALVTGGTRGIGYMIAEGLVNAIAPGPFPTKMLAAALEERGDEMRAANPTGRIGRPEDAAATVIFLSSRGSAFITGAVIPLDGGLSTTAKAGKE